MWLEGKDDIYEKAYLVHCADQLFIMWMYKRDRTLDSQLMDSREVDFSEENENNKEDITEQWEKGYDLPINETERKRSRG